MMPMDDPTPPALATDRLTPADLAAVYPALAAPLPDEAIQRLQAGENGRTYATTGYKYQYVINRLNAVLGPGHFRVLVDHLDTAPQHPQPGRPTWHTVIRIRLQLGNWVEGTWVPIAEALGFGGHEALTPEDAEKGALANALKKAAAWFGVGRHAYEQSLDDDAIVPTVPAPPDAAPPTDTWTARILDGQTTRGTSQRTQKPYTRFAGRAADAATGAAWPIVAFGDALAAVCQDALTQGDPVVLHGSWDADRGQFTITAIDPAGCAAPPDAPAEPVETAEEAAADPPAAGPAPADAAPAAPARASDPAPPVADPAASDPEAPPPFDTAVPTGPRYASWADLKPLEAQARAVGHPPAVIAAALRARIPGKPFTAYTAQDLAVAARVLLTLITQPPAPPSDPDVA